MTEALKTNGVYTLTVDGSDQAKDLDDNAILMYCVTNTVTGVREWEDTIFFTACSYLDQLSKSWEEIMEEKPAILVPNSPVPSIVQ